MLSRACSPLHWSQCVDTWPINRILCPENLEWGPPGSNQAKNCNKGLEWHSLPDEGAGAGGEQRKVISRMKQVCRENRGSVKREGEKDGERQSQSQLLPQFLLGVFVPQSFNDLRLVSYPCTFPDNLPLLIKPGGIGFYNSQPTKPIKQMRVYIQIIGPKRLEASTQPTYL